MILFIPALRLSAIYLAIATLGFGAAVQQLIPLPYWSAILGGHRFPAMQKLFPKGV